MARPAAAPVVRGLHARPELDDDLVGTYMQDAMERGGYRAALEYYDSEEAKKHEVPWHRLKARGWLLGRLGLYDRVQAWLEEASTWPDFDHFLAVGTSGQFAPRRTPALWLETPRPEGRNAGYLMTVEPAVDAGPDIAAVPDYIWSVMLILNTTGPIYSHAVLGAAAFLVGAGASRRARARAGCDLRHNLLRGARLHGAPDGCRRWIIADIDFDPRPVHRPHYYYDLTDEGIRALDGVRASGAPWPAAVEAAASDLAGMALPDLLEGACEMAGPVPGLGKMRCELGNLVSAWRDREEGVHAVRVGAADQTLADLGPPSKWHDPDDGPGSALDHLFCLAKVIRSAHKVACEAEPSTPVEDAVLRSLIGALQDLCRRHGRTVAAAVSLVGDSDSRDSVAGRTGEVPKRMPYEDATPALISDLYYCLAEYCKSRRLAVDPCSLPFPEQLTGDEKAAVAAALQKASPFHIGAG